LRRKPILAAAGVASRKPMSPAKPIGEIAPRTSFVQMRNQKICAPSKRPTASLTRHRHSRRARNVAR